MSGELGTVELEVPAGDVVAGDVLVLFGWMRRRVLKVERYEQTTGMVPGPRVRVIVSGSTSQAFENRAGAARGPSYVALEQQGLRPFFPDELLTVERPLEDR